MRFSASECLRSKIFDAIRIPAHEKSAPSKVMLDVDNDDAFDYNSGKSNKYAMEDYIKMIEREIEEVHAIRLLYLHQVCG